ncbi:MAG: hypothetical protein ACK5KK_00205, partial [Microbacterium sp.]
PSDEDDHTRVVDRPAPGPSDEDDHTRVVDRPAPDDRTAVVDRAKPQPSLTLPGAARRRGIAEPPVVEGFAPRAEPAVGPGAVETYVARDIPEVSAPPAAVEEGPAATRAAAPAMTSVRRRGRRTARVAVVTFTVACVLAVAGAVALAVIWL